MIDLGRKNILGIRISAIDYERAVQRILDDATAGRKCAVTALAVHGVITGALDPEHRHRLNSFDVVTPDGQPVRWALNLLYGTRLRDRVYGPKLTFLVCQAAARQGVPIYLYGSKPEVLAQLCERLQVLCPNLIIAGAEPSKFRLLSEEEQQLTAGRIKASGAQIAFVGLGCPRQEVFTYEMCEKVSMPFLAVGAAFDYYSGLLDEPPALLQRLGLQWLYRLVQEPQRLWRRYLVTNSQYVGLFVAQFLKLWRPSTQGKTPLTNVRYG